MFPMAELKVVAKLGFAGVKRSPPFCTLREEGDKGRVSCFADSESLAGCSRLPGLFDFLLMLGLRFVDFVSEYSGKGICS